MKLKSKVFYFFIFCFFVFLTFTSGILIYYTDVKYKTSYKKNENNKKINKDIEKNKKEELKKAEEKRKAEEKKKAEEKRKADSTFTLIAAGDILFHTPQLAAANKNGKYNFKENFTEIIPITKKGVSIVNFETSITNSGFMGYPTFRTPVAAVDAIKYAGFNIVTLAHNHSLDGGVDGLIRTKKEVEKRGIKTVGTFLDKNTLPTLVDIKGKKVAIINYTYSLNGLKSLLGNKQYMVNRIDKEKILNDIKYAKKYAKGIIAVMHWGTEYKKSPDNYQLEYSKFLAENGVDIILGTHPHAVEPAGFIEVNGHKTFCIFSMGNFLSNQRREHMGGMRRGEDGVMVELKVKFKENNRIEAESVKYYPTWVKKTYTPLKYTILPIDRALEGKIKGVSENDKVLLKESKQRTMNILGKEYKFK